MENEAQLINKYQAEFENACDDLYYGYGYKFWRTNNNSIEDDNIAKMVWKAAFNKMSASESKTKNMKKDVVKINEGQLREMIDLCVKNILKESYGDSDYAIMERAEEMIRNGYDYGYIEDCQTWEELTEGGPYSDIYESAEALSEEFDINIDEALIYLQKAFNNYENMYEGKNIKQVTISESKLREMIKESTKRILKEKFDNDEEKFLDKEELASEFTDWALNDSHNYRGLGGPVNVLQAMHDYYYNDEEDDLYRACQNFAEMKGWDVNEVFEAACMACNYYFAYNHEEEDEI